MSARWRWIRLAAAAAVLGVVAWRVGAGPFLDGLRRVDGRAVAAAVVLNAVATVAASWRWRVVATALGAELPLRAAVVASYRAQFLNVTLPGGVLGDVHRGLRHGRASDDVGRGLRAVAWERCSGQVVQLGVVLALLATFPSPVRGLLPDVLLVAGGVALAVAVASVALGRVPRRWSTRLRDDARALLPIPVVRPVALNSLVVVAAHLTTFVVAARTAGADLDWRRLLPVAAVVLLAMGLPVSLGGWGPREGAAAWAFAAAGSTAAQGVAAATVYGVLVLAASLPGAAALIAPRRRSRRPAVTAAPVDADVAPRVPVGSGRA